MRAWRTLPCGSRPFSSSRVFERRFNISELLKQRTTEQVEVSGWVRSVRKQKRVAFAAIGDGSTTRPLQAVLRPDQASDLSYGSAVQLVGSWQTSAGSKQSHELQVSRVQVLGENDAESSPIQAKYQTPEYLRTVPHLRPRIPSNAILLHLRSRVKSALTRFFEHEGFVNTDTPIITSSDCEGAGEVFTVSPNAAQVPEGKDGERPSQSREHFFRAPKYLTVSAQLHLEALALAVGKVWTLSPTFRAEKSDTPRHLSEFYMLEGEMCFVDDMNVIMDLIERMLQAVASDVQSSAIAPELLQLRQPSSSDDPLKHETVADADVLQSRWNGMAVGQWPRITYAKAIRELESAHRSKSFTSEPSYDGGLQAEHERFIAESVGQGRPVFVTDYPRSQKPFYMSASKDQGKDAPETVACFDLLVPDVCELAGGSMRESVLEKLQDSMGSKGLTGLEWYQDLRRFGSAPHGGFGLGFDRLLCYLSGIGNVRDMVAFPRYYGRCDC